MKFRRIVPQVNTHRLKESDFWYEVILSRWRSWPTPAGSSICRLPTSSPSACDVIGSLYAIQFLIHSMVHYVPWNGSGTVSHTGSQCRTFVLISSNSLWYFYVIIADISKLNVVVGRWLVYTWRRIDDPNPCTSSCWSSWDFVCGCHGAAINDVVK